MACEKEGYADLNDALKNGRYGKCVYHCNNDVVDHQTVNLEFEDGITAVFTMSAFSNRCGRDMRVMGTRGELFADFETGDIEVYDFANQRVSKEKIWFPKGGHSGADSIIMKEFVRLVANARTGSTDISISVQSHLMSFAAEKSRIEHRTVRIDEMV
ncbi:MAG: hypothetical protein EOM11_10690 [Erysipelotrichia bacterium]|nr:hypothetical protein [Erysipelotrichia bacterium]